MDVHLHPDPVPRHRGRRIIAGGLPNTHNYPYGANYRYTLQRATGVIAFLFIMLHVFHMHGWFHNDSWIKYVVKPIRRRPIQAVQRHEHGRRGAAKHA